LFNKVKQCKKKIIGMQVGEEGKCKMQNGKCKMQKAKGKMQKKKEPQRHEDTKFHKDTLCPSVSPCLCGSKKTHHTEGECKMQNAKEEGTTKTQRRQVSQSFP
jgi:hypothetical protein